MYEEERMKMIDTKDRIADCARRMFAEKGYNNVTVREVARAAQCSHTAVYMYFPNKCVLFAAVALPPLKALWQRVHVEHHEDRAARQRLIDMAFKFVGFAVKHKRLYDALVLQTLESVTESETMELAEVRRNLYEELKATMHSAMRFSLAGADITDAEQDLAAQMFFYTLHGLVAAHLHSGTCTDDLIQEIKRNVETAVDVTIGGCANMVRRTRPRFAGRLAASTQPL